MAIFRQFGTCLRLCGVYQSACMTVGKSSCQQCPRNWLPGKLSQYQENFVYNSLQTACQYRQFVTLTRQHGSQVSRLLSQEFRIIRHFKQTPKRKAPVQPGQDIFKRVMFTVTVCSGSFFIASVAYKYRIEKKLQSVYTGPANQFVRKVHYGRRNLNHFWNTLTDVKKTAYIIVAINTAVFVLWKVPSLLPVMTRYFTSSPGNPLMSMVFSTFSHMSAVHLFVNMYVLLSFSSVLKMDIEEFVAVYISTGTIASLTSTLNMIARKAAVRSIGASGAIMALIGLYGFTNPNDRLAIAFLVEIIPHSFNILTGITAIVLLDTTGLLFGWKILDHAGHLGGMVSGLLYAKYGRKLWLMLPAVKSANKSIRDSYR